MLVEDKWVTCKKQCQQDAIHELHSDVQVIEDCGPTAWQKRWKAEGHRALHLTIGRPAAFDWLIGRMLPFSLMVSLLMD